MNHLKQEKQFFSVYITQLIQKHSIKGRDFIMNFTTGIVPDIKETFGDLLFAGFKRDKFEFNQDTQRVDRDKLEARVYNLMSSVQGEQIEITIPGDIDLKEFNFAQKVALVNPRITARATSSKDTTFANMIFTVTADDIIFDNASAKTPPVMNIDNKDTDKVAADKK